MFGMYLGTDRRQVNHFPGKNCTGVARCSPAFSLSPLHPLTVAAAQPGWRNCGACTKYKPGGQHPGRSRKVSQLRAVKRQILQLIYNACPVLPGSIHGSGFCKLICLLLSFFQSFAVITPPIQATCRSDAQSRHLEEHVQVREDHTGGRT